jgi:hypothetical protein
MSTGLVVELDLPLLKLLLARLQTNLVESLYSEGDIGLDVYGSVDNSVGTYTKDSGQLQSSGEDLAETFFRGAESTEGR